MGKHVRKLFSVEQVKEVFQRYLARQIGVEQGSAILKIRRRPVFQIVKSIPGEAREFFFGVLPQDTPRTIDAKAEKKITQELKKEAAIIQDKRNPVQFYNYSYVKEILENKYEVLPIIIDRAKKIGITNQGCSQGP